MYVARKPRRRLGYDSSDWAMDLAYLQLLFAGPTGAPAAAANVQQVAASMTPAPSSILDTQGGWLPPLPASDTGLVPSFLANANTPSDALVTANSIPWYMWVAFGVGGLLLIKALK